MYRDFKSFIEEIFNQELCTSLFSETVHDYTIFENNFIRVLNRHVPLIEKVRRVSHAPNVTKALRKAIMKRSYFEKLFFPKKRIRQLNL